MFGRIQQNYLPTKYDLYLHIAKNKPSFDATVTIFFQKNQHFDDNKIYLNTSSSINIKSITQNNINLEYNIIYPKLIIFSNNQNIDFTLHPITIEYSVSPNVYKKFGFYFYDGNYLTDFEPCGARQFLPCFDEPLARSTFSVKLLIPSELTAVSNMPISSINKIEQEQEVTFYPTPPMSAYLLCICVGNFSSIYDISGNNTFVEFFTQRGNENELKEYIKVATFSLNWLESKFQVKYELPHLQLISLNGCPPGMENYGLITLADYTTNHEYFLERAFVIMHEIVHQWFGDLVSIKYWDSLWLNEGFAEFIQYLIMRDFRKELNDNDIFEIFAKKEGFRALEYYDYGELAPKESDIDFDYLFDKLTYSKGAFVTKMFYDLIGEEKFFEVCNNYLLKFKHQSVDIFDFISFVNSTVNDDFSSFFEVWLKKYGFPVLIVTEIEKDGKNIAFDITQESDAEVIFKLKVPVIFEKDGEIKKIEIIADSKKVHVELEFDWIVVNHNFASLCFVIYSKKLLKLLAKLENIKQIGKLNREYISKSLNNENLVHLVDEEMKEIANDF